MCSRLEIGSAVIPNSASSPETADAIRSRYSSGWLINAAGGASNDRRTVSDNPALLPGV